MKKLLIYTPTVLTLLLVVAMLLYGPIAQLPHYHEFADTRKLLGVPNALDVLSNAGFAIVGLWGMLRLWPQRRHPALAAGWPGYSLFMVALVLTAMGSSYYHLAPDNARLVWDRLPIALACAGLLVGVRAENGSAINAPLWAFLLGAGGALSVGWWYVTEELGQGDLRFYLLLQLLPLVLIPLWHVIHHAPSKVRIVFGAAVILYGFAKAAELSDHAMFISIEWLSGHTIKHFLATLASGILVHHLITRVQR